MSDLPSIAELTTTAVFPVYFRLGEIEMAIVPALALKALMQGLPETLDDLAGFSGFDTIDAAIHREMLSGDHGRSPIVYDRELAQFLISGLKSRSQTDVREDAMRRFGLKRMPSAGAFKPVRREGAWHPPHVRKRTPFEGPLKELHMALDFPLRGSLCGIDIVIIPSSEYVRLGGSETLSYDHHPVDASIAKLVDKIRPFGGWKSDIDKDREVALFVADAALSMSLSQAQSACIDRFGVERSPSRSGIARYWRRLRSAN